MTKPKYKLGDKIFKYDFESNSIQELMINEIDIKEGIKNTMKQGIIKKDVYYVIHYRLASRNYSNCYIDLWEFDINRKYFFDSIEKLKQHLFGCYKEQNKLSNN